MTKLSGCYKIITKKRNSFLRVVDDVVTAHQAGKEKPFDRIKIEYGEFGQVHPKIENITGKKNYNFKLSFNWNESNPDDYLERLGLVTDDATRLYFKKDEDPKDIEIYALISQAEADEIEADEGDPMEAPPGPYKIQPEVQGKLVLLTGAPGAGKSTTAQLLGRLKGYVYYEVDCFMGLKNPYIPLDVPNPTMAQDSQRHLAGEGMDERKAKQEKLDKCWQKILFQKEPLTEEDWSAMDDMYDCLAEDIGREKERIGGNWVVAGCLLTKRERGRVRAKFGSDILVVHLVMTEDDVTQRLDGRHNNDKVKDILMTVYNVYKTDDEHEDNVVVVRITKTMDKEEVMDLVLAEIEKYFSG